MSCTIRGKQHGQVPANSQDKDRYTSGSGIAMPSCTLLRLQKIAVTVHGQSWSRRDRPAFTGHKSEASKRTISEHATCFAESRHYIDSPRPPLLPRTSFPTTAHPLSVAVGQRRGWTEMSFCQSLILHSSRTCPNQFQDPADASRIAMTCCWQFGRVSYID